MQTPAALGTGRGRVRGAAIDRVVKLYAFAWVAPFIAAILAVLNPRDPASRNIIWIFTISFGALFYIAAGSGADSVRYAQNLRDMHGTAFGLSDLAAQFFAQGSRYQDVYQPLLTWVVALLTDQYWLLFAVFGILFGYVYSRNIWFLIDRIPGRIGLLLAFLLAAFAFTIDIGSGLNGVRMWTALHVFLFGYLNFQADGKRRYLAVILASPLIHFSFWFALLAAGAYFLVRRFGSAVYVFFLVSFLGAAVDLSMVQSVINLIPLPIEERATAYMTLAERNPDYVTERRNAAIWFLQLDTWLNHVFFAFAASWMVWRGTLMKEGLVRNLLVFGMLFYGLVNVVSYIPSLGRFYALGGMVLLGALILFLANHAHSWRIDRQVFAAASVMLVIGTALGVRFMLGFTSIWLVAGNIFIAPFVSADMSLYEVIFYVLRRFR